MEEKRQSVRTKRVNLFQSRSAIVGITLTVVLLLVIILVVSGSLSRTLASNNERTEMLKEQIRAEEQRTQEIKELQEYMKSDEYLEKAAKEKLGFVKDGEIIYKESE